MGIVYIERSKATGFPWLILYPLLVSGYIVLSHSLSGCG